MPGGWTHVAYPWRAAVGEGVQPAAFYVSLVGQALRFGLPARRGAGAAWALAARRGLPEAPVTVALGRLPRRPRPELDALLDALVEAWPALAARSSRLPSAPPPLQGLALQRSAALTLFAFGKAPQPLVVLKVPSSGDGRVKLESSALRQAEPSGVAPRWLARVGTSDVQEGLEGRPLSLGPLRPEEASTLGWSPAYDDLAEGLCQLASTTSKAGFPEEIRAAVDRALAHGPLGERTRGVLAAAWRDVSRLEVSVLRHHDTSAQNCLFSSGRLSGIVDWEMAVSQGAPGFDAWNAALSYTEYGIGLVRWSQERVATTFASAFIGSQFWEGARGAARRAASAGGVPDALLDPLEVVFFGSRVGDRLLRPGVDYPTGAAASTRMLEVVCAA